MRKAYCGINPSQELISQCREIDFKDVALSCGLNEMFICYSSKVPKFSPKNFILVLDKLTPAVEKMLKLHKYFIHNPEFYSKRLLSDQNRMSVFEDMEKLEHLHLHLLAKNHDKAGVNVDILSKAAELCHEWIIPNEILKAAVIFSTKASDKIDVIRY